MARKCLLAFGRVRRSLCTCFRIFCLDNHLLGLWSAFPFAVTLAAAVKYRVWAWSFGFGAWGQFMTPFWKLEKWNYLSRSMARVEVLTAWRVCGSHCPGCPSWVSAMRRASCTFGWDVVPNSGFREGLLSQTARVEEFVGVKLRILKSGNQELNHACIAMKSHRDEHRLYFQISSSSILTSCLQSYISWQLNHVDCWLVNIEFAANWFLAVKVFGSKKFVVLSLPGSCIIQLIIVAPRMGLKISIRNPFAWCDATIFVMLLVFRCHGGLYTIQ
jgi:hypothetical protein